MTKDRTRISESQLLWIAFVTLASLALSRAFACAMPFAAIAVLSASTLPKRYALAQVLLVWFANQTIGFGLMHYPLTASTFGWGAAIGLAALASLGAAWSTWRWTLRAKRLIATMVTLIASYTVYEAVLLLATSFLPSGSGAFTLSVLSRILEINVIALGLLLAANQLAKGLGFPMGQVQGRMVRIIARR